MSTRGRSEGGNRASGIDWAQVRARVDSAWAALQERWARPREERFAILRSRARAFARGCASEMSETETMEVLSFILESECYAVEVCHVKEVCALRELAPLPGVPDFVLGLTNVRGRILPVLDLRRFLDLPGMGLADLNKVIVLGSGNLEVGVLADAIPGVRTLRRDEIQPAPSAVGGHRAESLAGVTADRTILLDGARLIEDERLVHPREPGT